MFDPALPAGTNNSASSAISADGRPEIGLEYTIPARCGIAVRVGAGQTLKIINTHGSQVCDFWAFRDPDVAEYMSMAHTHTALSSIMPEPGDTLVTNNRTPILEFLEDSSPGVHDTVVAACDAVRYQQLGVDGYHDNCTDNLRMALGAIGYQLPAVPAPFNIWMNIPVATNGSFSWASPVSKPGDSVRFGALMDCIAVMSACPQDITPVNGEGVEPTTLAFCIF